MKAKYLIPIVLVIVITSTIIVSSKPASMLNSDSKILNITKHAKQIKIVKMESIKKIPVLMYHAISNTNSELCVSPDSFKEQMEWLKENNYHPVTLNQLYRHWEFGEVIPQNPIVLTFDDGYLDNYTIAFQEMKKHNFVGVLFIYANKFNVGNNVTALQLKEMQEFGWEIGNHSYYHRELTRVSDSDLIQETETARTKLGEISNGEITSFCYPAGKYDDRVVQAVKDSGHVIAVTTNYGYSKQEQGILTLSRVRINRSDHLKGYIRKLT